MLRESGPAGNWTCDLSVASPTPYRSATTHGLDVYLLFNIFLSFLFTVFVFKLFAVLLFNDLSLSRGDQDDVCCLLQIRVMTSPLMIVSFSSSRTNTRLTARRKRSTRRATRPVTSFWWRMRCTAGCSSVAAPRSTTDTSDARRTWPSWRTRAALDARRARSPSRTRCSPSRSRVPRISSRISKSATSVSRVSSWDYTTLYYRSTVTIFRSFTVSVMLSLM